MIAQTDRETSVFSAPALTPVPYFPDGELLRYLLDHIPDRIYFKDRQSRFIRCSRTMAELFGLEDPAQLIGKSDFDFFPREHALAAFRDEQCVMRTGRPIVAKVENETLPDGQVRWAITTKMPLLDEHGKMAGTCGISKDFTSQKAMEDALAQTNAQLAQRQSELERAVYALREAHEQLKAAQKELVEAEKHLSVGRLAFGVAHEIRNPLSVLTAGLDYLSSQPEVACDAGNGMILNEMQQAVRDADAVICTLLDSSGTASLHIERIDLEPVIRRALATVAMQMAETDVTAVTEFAASLPPVRIERGKMERVFVGLFQNAIDAMPGGGRLTVRTRLETLLTSDVEREPGLRCSEQMRAGDRVVVIEIEDTGPGIPAELLAKVFDPFFTTKETGTGTGLGLTVCRKIVELHHGAICLSNRPSGGLVVTIRLGV